MAIYKNYFNKCFFKKLIWTIISFFVLFTIYISKNMLILLTDLFPTCYVYELTRFYCPGCGNTRSVISLLNLNILQSLKYNITPISLVIFFTLYFIQIYLKHLNKKVTLIPTSKYFWIFIFIFFMSYFILRNFIPVLAP